ncbi:hypothetical protein SteCoe_18250 [Stentor coeruleus]|uniref:Major facilitator superfamily (MFS) profile domain-containing protein n=1 Tax=Stentor coeruleus TaxID=5963 RepID=A0A1R2BXJ8_9CILI|nr:hypothetical protein SteCoe_18250 [Stentor coeruleus]
MPYVESYFYNRDHSINISDFVIIIPIGQLSAAIGRLFVGHCIRYIYPYWIFLFGSIFINIGMFFCSYITNPTLFCWAYGLFLGGLPAFTFLPTVWNLWNHFPTNKGKVNGILLAGVNFGPVIFSFIYTMIANPYNNDAETVENDGQEKQKVFGDFVSERVPMTIRWGAIISLFLCFIGYIFLPKTKGKNNLGSDNKEIPTLTFTDMLRNCNAWNIFFLLATTSSGTVYLQSMYKVLGMIYINDDHFISFIGSAGFAIGCVGQLIFGFLYDKFQLKRVLVICLLVSLVFMITFNVSLSNKLMFSMYFLVLSFVNSSIYNGILLQGAKDFPKDRWVFSYASNSLVIPFALPYVFQRFITPIIGYFSTLLILSGIIGIGVVQVLIHPDTDVRKNVVEVEKQEFLDKD